MRMSVDERITTILVDTCAFRDANSDFIGISCVNAEITPIDEDEMALRCLREDKGYSRRG